MFAFLVRAERSSLVRFGLCLAGGIVGLAFFPLVGGAICLPNNKAGLIEPLLSLNGAIREGRMAAMAGQNGYQSLILRGGIYFLCWKWLCRLHGDVHRSRPVFVTCGGEFGEVAIARNGISGNNAALLQVAGVTSLLRPARPHRGQATAAAPGYGPN